MEMSNFIENKITSKKVAFENGGREGRGTNLEHDLTGGKLLKEVSMIRHTNTTVTFKNSVFSSLSDPSTILEFLQMLMK